MTYNVFGGTLNLAQFNLDLAEVDLTQLPIQKSGEYLIYVYGFNCVE